MNFPSFPHSLWEWHSQSVLHLYPPLLLFFTLSDRGQKVISDHSQPCSGSNESPQILQNSLSHNKELQLAPQLDQSPSYHGQCTPHSQAVCLSKGLFTPLSTVWDSREQHGDLVSLSGAALDRRCSKEEKFFPFPQAAVQSSATRPGPLSCLLKTTVRPPRSTSPCSSAPNLSCSNGRLMQQLEHVSIFTLPTNPWTWYMAQRKHFMNMLRCGAVKVLKNTSGFGFMFFFIYFKQVWLETPSSNLGTFSLNSDICQ